MSEPTRILYVYTDTTTHRAVRVRAATEERTMSEVANAALKLYLRTPAGVAVRKGPRPKKVKR